jgi:hypothetical protein
VVEAGLRKLEPAAPDFAVVATAMADVSET